MATTTGKSPVTQAEKDAIEREITRRCKACNVTRATLYHIVPSVAARATVYKEGSRWHNDNT